MFFRRGRNLNQSLPPEPAAIVSTIPEVFYGGGNPEAMAGKTQGQAKAKTSGPVDNPGHTRAIATLMIIVFLAACAGAAWYYFAYLRPDKPIDPAETAVENPPINQSAETTPIITPTTTVEVPELSTSTTSTATTSTAARPSSLSGIALEFPNLNQIDSTDFDADGLTDAEEEIFSTDPAIFDSDKDEYYDGQEVSNLYNPKGLAPVRIIDSGLVREYTAPSDRYRFYYPIAWTVGAIDALGTNILITASNGDYFEVRQFTKDTGEDFSTWFAKNAPGERITDLAQGVNDFGVAYYHRQDDLVTYVDRPNLVIVFIYHPASPAPVNFRHVMQMLITSLRISGVTAPN